MIATPGRVLPTAIDWAAAITTGAIAKAKATMIDYNEIDPGIARIESDAAKLKERDEQIARLTEASEAVIRYSVAVACFENSLGSAEDVKAASDDLCAMGLRLSQHEAAVLHQCGACQLAALTGKKPLHVHV